MNKSQNSLEELLTESVATFPKDSRIWIYQLHSEKELPRTDKLAIQQRVKEFANQWKVHGKKAKAHGELLFGQFILFVVSSATPASGCSIDASVNFLQQLEREFNVQLFQRTLISYIDEESKTIKHQSLKRLKHLLKTGDLDPDTIFFDNTITTLAQLDGSWMVPFRGSWMM